jgi:hypothetical protein
MEHEDCSRVSNSINQIWAEESGGYDWLIHSLLDNSGAWSQGWVREARIIQQQWLHWAPSSMYFDLNIVCSSKNLYLNLFLIVRHTRALNPTVLISGEAKRN